MASRDLHNNLKMKQLLKNAAASTTQTSSSVDTRGFDSAELLIAVGELSNVGGSPAESWSFKLQDSDDDSTFADVVDSDLVLVDAAASPVTAPDSSSGVFLVVDAASEDDEAYRVGYSGGGKRYVRVVGTPANTPGSTPLWIGCLLGNAALAPTSDG